MPDSSSFHLRKWYFDGICADGRALIAYAAQLQWLGINIPYAGYLYLRAPGDRSSASRFRQVGTPEVLERRIRWADPGWQLDGTWTADSQALRLRLYEGPEGFVDWNCLQPSASCRIQLGQEPPLEGRGYVECLEMTLPPWQLGIRELRWGRFADPDFPVVWIDWLGALNRRWVFANGILTHDSRVTDAVVQMPEQRMTLQLDNPELIEDKEKMREVLQALSKMIPGIGHLAALRFFQGKETKWRSSATLVVPDAAPRKGWAIHELVTF